VFVTLEHRTSPALKTAPSKVASSDPNKDNGVVWCWGMLRVKGTSVSAVWICFVLECLVSVLCVCGDSDGDGDDDD
jgi:hypothetical protein